MMSAPDSVMGLNVPAGRAVAVGSGIADKAAVVGPDVGVLRRWHQTSNNG